MTLDRNVRAFVARATEIGIVVPGNAPIPRPLQPYASLLTISDTRTAAPTFHQLRDTAGNPAGTVTATQRRRTYSLQFYRDGAIDRAVRFAEYAQSENGLLDAQTAFGSYGGRVRKAILHARGSYTSPPAVTVTATTGSGARLEAVLTPGTGRRSIDRLDVVAGGADYVSDPVVQIAAGSGDTQATATAIGWGFVVEQPLEIRRLDSIIGDAFEERANIDLPIGYATVQIQATGAVTDQECELIDASTGIQFVRSIR